MLTSGVKAHLEGLGGSERNYSHPLILSGGYGRRIMGRKLKNSLFVRVRFPCCQKKEYDWKICLNFKLFFVVVIHTKEESLFTYTIVI